MADKFNDDNFENDLFGIESNDLSKPAEFEKYQEAVISQEREKIKEAAHEVVSAASLRADERLTSGHFNDKDELEKYIQYVKLTRDPELMLVLPELEERLREMENMTDVVVARNSSAEEKEMEFSLESIDTFMSEEGQDSDLVENLEDLMFLQQRAQQLFAKLLQKGVMKMRSVFGDEEEDIYVFDPQSEEDFSVVEALHETVTQLFQNIGCEITRHVKKDEKGNIVENEFAVVLPEGLEGNIDIYNLTQPDMVRILEAREQNPDAFRTQTFRLVYDSQMREQEVAQKQEIDDITAQGLPQAEAKMISEVEELPEADVEVISQDLSEAEIKNLPEAQAIDPELAASLSQDQVDEILAAQNEVREALMHNKTDNTSQDSNRYLPTNSRESDNVKG